MLLDLGQTAGCEGGPLTRGQTAESSEIGTDEGVEIVE